MVGYHCHCCLIPLRHWTADLWTNVVALICIHESWKKNVKHVSSIYYKRHVCIYIYIYLFFQFTVRVSMTDSCSRVIGDGWHGRLWTFGTWTKRRLVCSSLHRGFIQAQKVGSTANYRHLKASWSGIKLGNISKIIIKFTAHWFLEG